MGKLTECKVQLPEQSEEISLIDLACILNSWRRLVLAVFLAILALGMVFAFLKVKVYSFTSIYQLAEINDGKSLQSAASVLVSVNTIYIPEALDRIASSNPGKMPSFRISADNPSGTDLIVLKTKGTSRQTQEIKQVQGAVLARLSQQDNSQLTDKRNVLNMQLRSVKKQLETLRSGKGNELEIAAALRNRDSLERQLSNLSKGEITATARKSLKPEGPGKLLIISLALVFAGMLAVFSGFFAEFVMRVRQRLS